MIRQREPNVTGVSREDYVYRTFRCVVCFQPVQMTEETLEIMVNDEVERWRLQGNHSLEEEPSALQIKAWRAAITDRERGHALGFRQYIHERCLIALNEQESQATRDELTRALRKHNHDYIIVPEVLVDTNGHNPYVIYSSLSYPLANYKRPADWVCRYCDEAITDARPGFSYKKKTKLTPPKHHLHYECYIHLREQQDEAVAKDVRFFQGVADGLSIDTNEKTTTAVEENVGEEPAEDEGNEKSVEEVEEPVIPSTLAVAENEQEADEEEAEKAKIEAARQQLEELKVNIHKQSVAIEEKYTKVYEKAKSIATGSAEPTQADVDDYNDSLDELKSEIDALEEEVAKLAQYKLADPELSDRLAKMKQSEPETLEVALTTWQKVKDKEAKKKLAKSSKGKSSKSKK